MGQAPANCSCVPQASAVVESVSGDIKKGVDTFESDSETRDGIAESRPVLPCRQALVLARRRVFSPHLRSGFSDHYRIVRQVGEGTYGNVFEAETQASAAATEGEGGATSSRLPRRVAVKCFKISQARADDPSGVGKKTLKESFEKERAILARAEHPHIVKMYECFEEKSSLWVVLELCRGGELYEYVAARAQQRKACGGAFDESEARLYFRQMLHAVGFLQASRIVHRDIKTENFLLLGDPATPEGSIVKLCDFGTAVQLSDQMPRAMGRIGTLSYTAPEIYARRGADLCADLWSLGVVLYVLLVGASPFRTTGIEPRSETSKRIVAGDYDTSRPGWVGLSGNARDIIAKLLVVEERSRLKMSQAMQHPWMEPSVPLLALRKPIVEQHRVLSPISQQEADLADYAVHIERLLLLITRFARLDPLQQLLISVYAQVTPDSELSELDLRLPWYELFFALDEDDDGRLGFSELTRGLQKLVALSLGDYDPKQEARVNMLVRALDLDGSGYVDWVEWTALALSSCSTLATQPEPLLTVFRMVDRPSGDGAITAVDLLALLNSDSAGRSLSTAQAQQQALSLIGKWAPQRSKAGRPGGVPATAAAGAVSASSLLLEDVRSVLKAATSECSQPSSGELPRANGGNRIGTAGPAKQISWLRCCEQTQQDFRPEMVMRVPAIQPVWKDPHDGE